jgi:hypothetical protein
MTVTASDWIQHADWICLHHQHLCIYFLFPRRLTRSQQDNAVATGIQFGLDIPEFTHIHPVKSNSSLDPANRKGFCDSAQVEGRPDPQLPRSVWYMLSTPYIGGFFNLNGMFRIQFRDLREKRCFSSGKIGTA